MYKYTYWFVPVAIVLEGPVYSTRRVWLYSSTVLTC